jgi:hypothetical protein
VPVTVTGGVVGGAHSVAGDPAFRNPAQDNYHPANGSAAVDKGINAQVPLDIDGEPRPFGAGFDIGFDELFNGPKLVRPLVER